MTWKKIVLIIIGSFLVSFASYYLFNNVLRRSGEESLAALRVESTGKPLTVVLDNKVLGKTPYNSDSLKEGSASLVLSSEENVYRTKVNLTGGTLTVVNWDLGPSDSFSEGVVIWLEKIKSGRSLVVFGSPEGADVRVDDEFIGSAPVSNDKISAADPIIKISKQGYKTRVLKVKAQEGYKLSIKFQLLLNPGSVEEAVTMAFPDESRFLIKDFSTDSSSLYSDTKNWARGLSTVLKNDESSTSADRRIEYFFDYQGRIYDKSGFKLAETSEPAPQEKLTVGYLGKKTDNGITEDAKKSILAFGQKALANTKKVEILQTGTGWLRVRATPSLSAEEVAKVNVGEKIILLAEQGTWYQVKLSDGKTGWIAASFAKKL